MSSQEFLTNNYHHRLNDDCAYLVRNGYECLGHCAVVLIKYTRDKQDVDKPNNSDHEHEHLDNCYILRYYSSLPRAKLTTPITKLRHG